MAIVKFKPNKDNIIDNLIMPQEITPLYKAVSEGFFLTPEHLTNILCFQRGIYLKDIYEYYPVDGKVILTRYNQNYKIDFVSVSGGNSNNMRYSYYIMDFCSLVNDGTIEISFDL